MAKQFLNNIIDGIPGTPEITSLAKESPLRKTTPSGKNTPVKKALSDALQKGSPRFSGKKINYREEAMVHSRSPMKHLSPRKRNLGDATNILNMGSPTKRDKMLTGKSPSKYTSLKDKINIDRLVST